MKKALSIILALLILTGIAFLFAFIEQPNSLNDSDQKQESPEKVSEQEVISYLKTTSIDAKEKVFADYYKFGREQNKLFIWSYVASYSEQDGKLKLRTGRSAPMIITLDKQGIKSHWLPRSGQKYPTSIKEKFPGECVDEVLNFQTRHKDTLNQLTSTVREKAKEKLMKVPVRNLSVGGIKVIELDSNRTTGYKWHYNITGEGVVKVVSDEYQPREHESGMVGIGGQRILKIKAIKPGTAKIAFEYYRDWEPKQVEKTKEIVIEVDKTN